MVPLYIWVIKMKEAWKKFQESGKVEDYLKYKEEKKKENQD